MLITFVAERIYVAISCIIPILLLTKEGHTDKTKFWICFSDNFLFICEYSPLNKQTKIPSPISSTKKEKKIYVLWKKMYVDCIHIGFYFK